MKHIHHIIRLLTLAVVSCALAALLSGCTKEEFIAGYNEFLFGDWLPALRKHLPVGCTGQVPHCR